MENLSIQKEFGWCNVHTLVNVLRDDAFLEFLSNEEYKSGDIDSMNEMIKLAGYSDFEMMQIIGAADFCPSIPQQYFTDIIQYGDELNEYGESDYPFIPYFLTVQIKAPHYHSVAILRFKNVYLYVDPYLKDVKMLKTPNESFGYFKKCIGIDRMVKRTTKGKNYLMFDGAKMGFDEMFL